MLLKADPQLEYIELSQTGTLEKTQQRFNLEIRKTAASIQP
jgi:hypothetical protein